MAKERNTDNREIENIGPLEVYDIFLRRHINEDRVVTERTSIFLAGSSFLFLAFVALLDPTLAPIFKVLRILLPIVGMFLAFLLYSLNRAAINALNFWSGAEQKIEEEAPEFAYMRENKIRPHIQGDECIWGKKEWIQGKNGKCALKPIGKPRRWLRNPLLAVRIIYAVCLPLAFLILWLGSIIVVVLD